jgi:DNA gyrase subunit A
MIAMKLGEGEAILGVETCTEADDVLLTTAHGQSIRFRVADVRVFAGRSSIGVRGIALDEGDRVISMAILHHFEATPAERAAYQKLSRAVRGEGEPEEPAADADEAVPAGELNQER